MCRRAVKFLCFTLLLVLALPVARFTGRAQEITGETWTGEPGRTETVAQIMGRDLDKVARHVD